MTGPTADWARVSLKLNHTGGWHVGSPDGPAATTREISTALQDVASLLIRAEHVEGAETGGLDNVAFRSRSEPTFANVTDEAFGVDGAGSRARSRSAMGGGGIRSRPRSAVRRRRCMSG